MVGSGPLQQCHKPSIPALGFRGGGHTFWAIGLPLVHRLAGTYSPRLLELDPNCLGWKEMRLLPFGWLEAGFRMAPQRCLRDAGTRPRRLLLRLGTCSM